MYVYVYQNTILCGISEGEEYFHLQICQINIYFKNLDFCVHLLALVLDVMCVSYKE